MSLSGDLVNGGEIPQARGRLEGDVQQHGVAENPLPGPVESQRLFFPPSGKTGGDGPPPPAKIAGALQSADGPGRVDVVE